MTRLLAEKAYWEAYWEFMRREEGMEVADRRDWLKNIFGRKLFGYMNTQYHNHLLWDVIYKKYIPEPVGKRALEVGSAPGYHLVKLNRTFGLVPYGVECSEEGVEVNRKVFRDNNLNPENIIHADFFSDGFQKAYRSHFNIVVSRGFIEDFGSSDAVDVVAKHLNLLADGGRVFATMPNFSGINYLGVLLFARELLPEINFDIMERHRLAKIFEDTGFDTIYCDYYGTFNCGGRFILMRDPLTRFVFFFLNNTQRWLNVAFRVLLKDRGLESSFFSPYIVYVGSKKGA